MRKLIVLAAVMAVALVGQAWAIDVAVHGDLQHQFNLYTNQSQMYKTSESVVSDLDGTAGPLQAGQVIDKGNNGAFFGQIKYRLWTELSSDDGNAKAVYNIELGGLRFGDSTYSKGGGATYSGDGVNIETRWAYGDFQLPMIKNKARVQIGLIPWNVNHYVWVETVMGVQLKGDAGPLAYTVGWARGHENYPTRTSPNAFQDADALLGRVDLKPMNGTKAGLFFLYQHQDAYDNRAGTETAYEIKKFGSDQYNLYTVGIDGKATFPAGPLSLFANWDAVYQGGKIKQPGDTNVRAYFLHADLGANLDRLRLTYTTWYSSGDNPNKKDIKNFMSTDVDITDSIIFFEGGYTNDNYFTEAPYIKTYGMYLNKLAADYNFTKQTKAGLAALYLMTAADLPNGERKLGPEVDAYVSHKLYPDVTVALNAGYLLSAKGMDNFSVNNNAGNVFRSTALVKYAF